MISFIIGDVMNLYEHQKSSFSPQLTVAWLFFFSRCIGRIYIEPVKYRLYFAHRHYIFRSHIILYFTMEQKEPERSS